MPPVRPARRRQRRGCALPAAAAAAAAAAFAGRALAAAPPPGSRCGTAQEWVDAAWTYTDGPYGQSCWFSRNLECSGDRQSPISLERRAAKAAPERFLHAWPMNGGAWLVEAMSRWNQSGAAAEREGSALQVDATSLPANLTTNPPPTLRLDRSRGLEVSLAGLNVSLTGSDFWDEMALSLILFKVPAEHVVDGQRHALERQMYFVPRDRLYSAPGRPATLDEIAAAREPVVAVAQFFDEGPTGDPYLAELRPYLQRFRDLSNDITVFETQVAVPPTLPEFYPHGAVFSYEGSLPFPPCTQTVRWYVSPEVTSVTTTQLGLLNMQLQRNNIRSPQPLNARGVSSHGLFRPHPAPFWPELLVCGRASRDDLGRCRADAHGELPELIGCSGGVTPPMGCTLRANHTARRDSNASNTTSRGPLLVERESEITREDEDLFKGIVALAALEMLFLALLVALIMDRCGCPLVSLPLGLSTTKPRQPWINPSIPGIYLEDEELAEQRAADGGEESEDEEEEEDEEDEEDEEQDASK
eukprot:TRINITY_DN4506_c0_g2_i1.p1 TRINITY_DN4506_c0_g2~~TRINITY_DN4506_c0_g2_i1.p1  ORF type:complete len:547 (+),score=160.58 TRINITY_DN4506_c0_g2_i1:55-1641(+)